MKRIFSTRETIIVCSKSSAYELLQGKIASVKNHQRVSVTGGAVCNTLMFVPQLELVAKLWKHQKEI